MNIEDLIQERDRHTTSFFWLGLHIAFIFGIPAAIAVILGKYLNKTFSSTIYTTVLLAAAFVISWIIVAIRYQKKAKVLNEIESKIREMRKEEDSKKAAHEE